MSKAKPAIRKRFIIDCTAPAQDLIVDPIRFERFLNERLKVNGRPKGNSKDVVISRNDLKVVVATDIPMAKRYLKYLTKKYLKKQKIRDFIRVVANSHDGYVLKYFNLPEA